MLPLSLKQRQQLNITYIPFHNEKKSEKHPKNVYKKRNSEKK